MADHEKVQRISAWFDEYQVRTSPRAMKAHRKRLVGFLRRLKYAFFAVLGAMLAAGLIGSFVTPLGIGGVLLTLAAMAILFFGILFWPSAPEPTVQQIAKTDLPLLPAQTERWLDAQRPALPAPAQRLADDIAAKLEALAPQMVSLDPREPVAFELRKLMAEELPDLVDGYRRVPENMRGATRDGTSPDKQLVEGLAVVSDELQRMAEQLASGDLKKLATQGRYLELKYKDGAEE